MKYKAFLFDLNGTMIDDMAFHLKAWYDILTNELDAGLSREEVKRHMYGKNAEVLDRIFGACKFSEEEKNAIAIRKEMQYQQAFKPYLQLLPGLTEFLKIARGKSMKMAIGTAVIPFNVDFVIDQLVIRNYFDAIITADDVNHSKPDAETFLKCAEKIGIAPQECLVFEDVPKGVEAAQNAGMDAVVMTTTHEPHEFTYLKNIQFFVKDFNDENLLKLIE